MADPGEGDVRFRLLLDAAPVMIWVAAADGRCTWFNRAWLDFTGRRLEEEQGDGWTAGVHLADLPEFRRAWAAHFDRRQPFRIEHRLRRADGTYRWVIDAGVPLVGADGGFEGYVGSCIDVTELKETEQDLRRMLEDRERVLVDVHDAGSLAQVMGGIAHGFNDLLTVIAGNLALIEAHAGPGEPVAKLARSGARAAARGGRLAAQLLGFERRSSEAEPLRLDHLVAEMTETLGCVLGEGITLETALGAELWATRVDRRQMQIALVNLALNARDAMPAGGTLRIEAGNVEIGRESGDDVAPGRYVLVKVTDTGTGMRPDVLERVGEPFFTTKPAGEGAGLGLVRAQRVMRRAGGELRINSAAGQGTTVRLYLPEWAGAAIAEHPRASDTILVVEDDSDVRELAVGVLEGLGFTVLQAADGLEALTLLRGEEPIQLLLTDIVMPGKNGVEVAREARALRPELPVVFTSGYASHRLIHETALDPETHILRKPWLPEDLDREIRAALARPAH